MKQRLPLPYFDQLLGKAEQIPSILSDASPIEPTDLVILCIGDRAISSPARIMGVPRDNSSVASKLRICPGEAP